MSTNKYDYILKIITVGDGEVGKTSLIVRYIENKFLDDYKMTIGVDFFTKLLTINNNRVKLQIWDTGGQERFTSIRPMYYKASVGGFVVFDKTNRQSFYNVVKWFEEVYNQCGEIPLILIGNKIDMDDPQISWNEARNIAKKFNTVYFETSAKNDISVSLAFETLVRMIIDPKYSDRLQSIGIEYEKSQIYYNEAYENYNFASNRATTFFQNGNYLETLEYLKDALFWAKKALFEEGIHWCEDQIIYISQLLEMPKPEEIKGIILACQNCNTIFKVRQEGAYTCPKCSSLLINISKSWINV